MEASVEVVDDVSYKVVVSGIVVRISVVVVKTKVVVKLGVVVGLFAGGKGEISLGGGGGIQYCV